MSIRSENVVVNWTEEQSGTTVFSTQAGEEAEFEVLVWSVSGEFNMSVYKIPYIDKNNAGKRIFKMGPKQTLFLNAWTQNKGEAVSGTILVQAIIKSYT